MNRVLPLIVLLFGFLVGMVASGALHVSPAFSMRWPGAHSPLPYPVVSFAVLAIALALRPRFLRIGLLRVLTLLSMALYVVLLAPALEAPAPALADGQTGMLEAWIAMSTVPFNAALLAVASVATLLPRSEANGPS